MMKINKSTTISTQSKNRISLQEGFTIVELMVATVVFTVMLVGAMAGLILVGRLYYKGVTNARLQEANRTIVSEITQSIQFSKQAVVAPSLTPASVDIPENNNPNTDTGFFCIGPKRYTYALDRKVKPSPSEAKERWHGLWADVPSAEACAAGTPPEAINVENPCSDGTCTDGRELLGENMRITRVNIEEITTTGPIPTGSGLWRVSVSLAYGDNDLLEVDNGRYICKPSTLSNEFCAISELSTTVLRRIP